MKLRFRQNSLRLRLNRREVAQLASGYALEEAVHFPDAQMKYVLEPASRTSPDASFREGTVRISAPRNQIETWANGEDIGIYFDLPANGTSLRVAIEKDLDCIDGPESERDPEAFPRAPDALC